MGSLTGAVHWWEESQLRVLVLTSMALQLFLLFFPSLRRKAIPGLFRFIMWLAYHGADAVAIYGLATLFNRHMEQGDGVGGGSSNDKLLEVVWAPVLLIHLGGSDGVTAYNIEDNELWTRHLLTAVSQVTVAVYVFSKSWPPGGDKRLLQTAILLFAVGVVRCFMKAWAFKRASIYTLVSSAASTKQMNDDNMCNKLEDYVKLAKDVVTKYTWSPLDRCQFVDERGSVDVEMKEAEYNLSKDGVWPQTVAQYSLAGYYVRNKKHSVQMKIASLVGCKDFLDQHWCMEPCFTSERIAYLVLDYLKDAWNYKIQDAASYRSFNNHSSHWGLNMNRPFDECVLLWHLATDLCFFSTSFPDHRCYFAEPPTRKPPTNRPQCSHKSSECKAVQCRQMSNYMVYLLFVNPEMLLPGTRRNIFKTAYGELEGMLRYWNWNPERWSHCMPCGVKLIEEEAIVMRRLVTSMEYRTAKRASQEESSNEAIARDTIITVTQQNSERSSQEGSSMEGSNRDKCFFDQACALGQRLLEMDELKRWEEIQDVWVQMLCFSASRCRGYLHAKALGKGGEFLSHVWLLLFYMGMETFSEKLQRDLFPTCQGNNDTASPPISKVCSTSTASSASTVHTHAGASAGTTASTSDICVAEPLKSEDNMV